MVLPDVDGELVGDQQALRRIPGDLLSEAAPLGNLAEHVAHRHVDEVGQLAEHRALRTLAATGHAEQENGAIPRSCGHRTTSARREWGFTDRAAPAAPGPKPRGGRSRDYLAQLS